MTTARAVQRRRVLPLLNLLVSGAALTLGLAAIATDDVSSRASQVVVVPLRRDQLGRRVGQATPRQQAVIDAEVHPQYNPCEPPTGQTAWRVEECPTPARAAAPIPC